jgi:hypothetical protein
VNQSSPKCGQVGGLQVFFTLKDICYGMFVCPFDEYRVSSLDSGQNMCLPSVKLIQDRNSFSASAYIQYITPKKRTDIIDLACCGRCRMCFHFPRAPAFSSWWHAHDPWRRGGTFRRAGRWAISMWARMVGFSRGLVVQGRKRPIRLESQHRARFRFHLFPDLSCKFRLPAGKGRNNKVKT